MSDRKSDARPNARIVAVGQAIYGERGGAHTLVARSEGPWAFAATTSHTDLPSTLPPGITWAPFERVFALREGSRETFVLSRTFPDRGAPRGGMVITHALFLALEEAVRIPELAMLAPLLAAVPPTGGDGNISPPSPPSVPTPAKSGAPGILPTLSIAVLDPEALGAATGNATRTDCAAPSGPQPHDAGPLRIRGRLLARALLDSPPGRPVVWVGQDGFWEAVCVVWRALTPAARRAFAARLSFGPADVEGISLTLVSTPEALDVRWPADTFRIVRSEAGLKPPAAPPSAAESLLAGASGGVPLVALARDLGAPLANVRDLRLLESVYGYLQMTERPAEATRALARLLARLSPDPLAGAAIKSEVVKELARITQMGSAADVLALANFAATATALPECEAIFDAVGEWVQMRAVPATLEGVDAAAVAALLTRAFSARPKAAGEGTAVRAEIPQSFSVDADLWRRVVLGAVTVLLGAEQLRGDAGRAVWSWWRTTPSLVPSLTPVMAPGAEVDRALATAAGPPAPPMSTELGQVVARAATGRQWPRTHAIAVAAALPPADAILAQLAFSAPPPDAAAGLQVLAERVPADALVAAAVAHPVDVLVTLAGGAIAQSPSLLRDLDVRVLSWRALWAAALRAGLAPWRGVRDRQAVSAALVEVTVRATDRDVTDAIWTVIAGAADTDVTEDPNRAALWDTLGVGARTALLAATADRWLAHFSADPAVWVPHASAIEPPLARTISDTRRIRAAVESWRSHLDGGAWAAGELFAVLPALTEAQFREAIRTVGTSRHVPAASVRALGAAAKRRGWRAAAADLADMALRRAEFLPAAYECLPLLGFFQSLRIRFAGSPVERYDGDDVWRALQELACEMYPRGPGHGHLWERIGGDPAELDPYGSGRDQWADAIRRLRHGGSRTSAALLVREMQQEYPNNESIRWLAGLEAFRVRGAHE